MIRQGDLLFVPVNEIPKEAKSNNKTKVSQL